MADFAAVILQFEKPLQGPASLQRRIEVILLKELKHSYCEILESKPAELAKLS